MSGRRRWVRVGDDGIGHGNGLEDGSSSSGTQNCGGEEERGLHEEEKWDGCLIVFVFVFGCGMIS